MSSATGERTKQEKLRPRFPPHVISLSRNSENQVGARWHSAYAVELHRYPEPKKDKNLAPFNEDCKLLGHCLGEDEEGERGKPSAHLSAA